jgi:retinoid hydroxylase
MANKLKSADEMPGSFGLPLIGETTELFSKLELFYWERYWKHGKFFKTSTIGVKYAYLIEPDANKLVLIDQAEKLSARIGWKFLEPILSNDVALLQDGEEHRTSRKMLMPLFHHQAIASYFDTIQSIVTSTVANWGKQESIDLDAELIA